MRDLIRPVLSLPTHNVDVTLDSGFSGGPGLVSELLCLPCLVSHKDR